MNICSTFFQATFRQHHINTNLISIIPIPDNAPTLHLETKPVIITNSPPPKLDLPQNRYHKSEDKSDETKLSDNTGNIFILML